MAALRRSAMFPSPEMILAVIRSTAIRLAISPAAAPPTPSQTIAPESKPSARGSTATASSFEVRFRPTSLRTVQRSADGIALRPVDRVDAWNVLDVLEDDPGALVHRGGEAPDEAAHDLAYEDLRRLGVLRE